MTIRTPETQPAPLKPQASDGRRSHKVTKYVRTAILSICLVQVVLFLILVAVFVHSDGFDNIDGSYAYSPSKPEYLFQTEHAFYSLLTTILYLSFGVLSGLSLCFCPAKNTRTQAIFLTAQLLFTVASGISLALFFHDVTWSFVDSLQFFQWNYQNPGGAPPIHFKPLVAEPPLKEDRLNEISSPLDDMKMKSLSGCDKMDIENGYVWYKDYPGYGDAPISVGDIVHFGCYPGFQLLGSVTALMCLPSGQYNGSAPHCASEESLRIQVHPPKIPNLESSAESESSEETSDSTDLVEIKPVLSVISVEPENEPLKPDFSKLSSILNLIKMMRQDLVNERDNFDMNLFNRPRQGTRLGGGPNIKIVFVTSKEMPGQFVSPILPPQSPMFPSPFDLPPPEFPLEFPHFQGPQLDPFPLPAPQRFFAHHQPDPMDIFSSPRQPMMPELQRQPHPFLLLPPPQMLPPPPQHPQFDVNRRISHNPYGHANAAAATGHLHVMGPPQYEPNYPRDISLDYPPPFAPEQPQPQSQPGFGVQPDFVKPPSPPMPPMFPNNPSFSFLIPRPEPRREMSMALPPPPVPQHLPPPSEPVDVQRGLPLEQPFLESHQQQPKHSNVQGLLDLLLLPIEPQPKVLSFEMPPLQPEAPPQQLLSSQQETSPAQSSMPKQPFLWHPEQSQEKDDITFNLPGESSGFVPVPIDFSILQPQGLDSTYESPLSTEIEKPVNPEIQPPVASAQNSEDIGSQEPQDPQNGSIGEWVSSFIFDSSKGEEVMPPPSRENYDLNGEVIYGNYDLDGKLIHEETGDAGSYDLDGALIYEGTGDGALPIFDEKRKKRSLRYPENEMSEPADTWNHQADLEVVSVLGGLVALIGLFLFMTIVSFVLLLLALRQLHTRIQQERKMEDMEAVESVTVIPVSMLPEETTSKTEECQTQKEEQPIDSASH